MSRVFRGLGLGNDVTVPMVQCDYQRCGKREQLIQPEPYHISDFRMLTVSERKEIRAEYSRLIREAPQPKGWPQVLVREDYDVITRDFCSWKHLRLYAGRMAEYCDERWSTFQK